MRKLSNVHSVVDFGEWATSKGFKCSGGPGKFGPVSPTAHTPTSLHYANPSRAFDINYYGGGRWTNEPEACNWLYNRVMRYELAHRTEFPLHELFFQNRGYKYYAPGVNVPISAHHDHLHIGFLKNTW
jgi:hypothetical protein